MGHILVIDDDLAIRCLLRITLEFHGYQVCEAVNGYEGLQYYQVNPTDLIITDMDMPVMNGTQLLSELRRGFPLAKVLVISGEKRLLERAKEFNIQGTFEKPFFLKDILQAVRELVDTHATPEPQYDAVESQYDAAACLTTSG